MRVVITQPIHASQIERLRAAGCEITELASPRGLTSAELVTACAAADALVCQLTDEVDAAVLGVPGLRLVSTVAAGHDNIDLAAARANDVPVAHTPGVLTEASADLALALMLAVARHLPAADASVRAGTAGTWKLLYEPMGIDLAGAVLGVVGMGRIGLATARRAHFGFGMEILYHSRSRHEAAESEVGATRLPLGDLLARADVVSLHAPLTTETRHLINAGSLALMRPGAILVNTARGGLVDEAALAAALRSGGIAGAGLDVFEDEPAVHPDLLACGDRVVLTPHIGSATARTRLAMSTLAIDAVLAVHADRTPAHLA